MKFLLILLGLISIGLCAVPKVPGILDCTFECSGSLTPVLNPNNTATTNGCGAYGIIAHPSLLPNSEFLNCCNSHDICYETCNTVRETCDKTFKDCMMNSCKNWSCRFIADSFYGAVQTLGCPSFLERQKKSCMCV
ncbi:hypothetical protein ACKWTF_011544 [Chironomus riparius]